MVSVTASVSPDGTATMAILLAMCLGVFIAQLDSQVVNLAVKQIGSDLDAGISQLQWVLDSYNCVLRHAAAHRRDARRPLRPDAHFRDRHRL